MHNFRDQFAKNLLRDALIRASTADTDVEVIAAAQKIDVYTVPDPARAGERDQMGLLGALSAEPSLFQPFSGTPGLREIRRCLRKQLTWHNERERRARVGAGVAAQEAEPEAPVPFPALVIICLGRPETVLEMYGCRPVGAGVSEAVPGLLMKVMLSELPRTRETLMLRLLGGGAVFRGAVAELAALPAEAWERGVATPLLVHFGLLRGEPADEDEEDEMSAEIRAWYEEFEKKLRSEARSEGLREGRREGERSLLVRLLRARFGELPAEALARIEAADVAEIERWGERVLAAQTLAEVLAEPS
ncbi:MAG: DUF4351 domain-containing protein [Polyangiaceae bacterium]|nr:DUF4351 domain-containing protein [Polyangiaceae bacterium]